ncbi:WAT1-related protein At1g68170 isoform X3 [Arachis hypogaea]|uniref:WAT1-related protein At1g68170 isoform X3 n=1 Tax=Arachis hypogaea TaxID=3818 RepID=UPI003B21B47B
MALRLSGILMVIVYERKVKLLYGSTSKTMRKHRLMQWLMERLMLNMLMILYQGIVGSRVVFLIIAWCIQMRGSLFVSIFNPLMLVLVLVAVAASFMLDEQLYLRSVIGVVLIVCGLYMVLWGKNKEMKKITQLLPSEIIQLQQ